jgi:hypothetical protein
LKISDIKSERFDDGFHDGSFGASGFVKFNTCLKVLPKTIGGNMAKKGFLLGMLGVALAFGMTIVGCATTFYTGGNQTFSDETVYVLNSVRESQLANIYEYGKQTNTFISAPIPSDKSVVYQEMIRIVTDYSSIQSGKYYAIKADSGKIFLLLRSQKVSTVTSSATSNVKDGAVGTSVSQNQVAYSYNVYEFSGEIPENTTVLK